MERLKAPLRSRLAALAAGAALVLGSLPAAAQTSDRAEAPGGEQPGPVADAPSPDSTPGIVGFFGVPWHADSSAVVEAMGPPISVARVEDGLRIFNYTPWFLDRDGFLALWIEEGEGLVHGSYEPVVSDCTWMLRQMVHELNRRHRSLSATTRGDVGEGVLEKDLCLAAMEDSARLTVTWEDAAGNRIQVGSSPGSPALLMTATSAGWQRR